MKKVDLCVGVVLYYPTLDEIENINNYIDSVRMVYIYDNSNEDNLLLIKKKISANNYTYICNKKNNGMSKALNDIFDLAYKDNFKYIMILDQDSIIEKKSIFVMKNCIQNNTDKYVAIYAPVIYFDNFKSNKSKSKKQQNQYIDFTITSGSIFDINIYKKLKGFDEHLFIDGVDRDYCLKIKIKKMKICEISNAVLVQTLGVGKKNIFGVYEHSIIRNYYIFRNRLYIIAKYPFYFKGRKKVCSLYLSIIKQLLSILFCEKNKISKLKIIRKSFEDFKKNKMGEIQ